MVAIYIIAIILYFVINVCAYSRFREIAAMKGHPDFKFAVWIILFGVVGMLMVVALPDRGEAFQTQPSPSVQPQSMSAPDELPEL